MAINRRSFLALLGTGVLALPQTTRAAQRPQKLLSCRSDLNGHHYLSVFDLEGGPSFDIPLPARGHGVAVHPHLDQITVFARRPGEFMWVIAFNTGEVLHRIASPEGRHFYGHGVYSGDSSLLFVSENDFDNGSGIIGIYDARHGYQRLGEIESHGVGPHELGLLSDSKTLVIANGGIKTHPDLGRTKLNLETMQPNLAYVDLITGQLIDRFNPPEQWYQLSIRHIDINSQDQVCIAMQYEGSKRNRPPLVALHQGENQLNLLEAPDEIQSRMKNYCGSARFASDGTRFAISSPRGGIITFWSSKGEYLGHSEVTDGCGIAAAPGNRFFLSSGEGKIMLNHPDTLSAQPYPGHPEDMSWDNHLNLV
jgi:hypothetical protein